jgi:hypothetical protein
MNVSMTLAAEHDQVVESVVTAMCPKAEVVNIELSSRSASLAAPAISLQDG